MISPKLNEALSSLFRKAKTRITIRLDEDILEWFRLQVEEAGGGNYQTLINDSLRQHIRRLQEPLEATLRCVIREELKHARPVEPHTRSDL